MSTSQAVFGWLERTSDWLNPIVVKEVRQLARGREFHYSFSISLLIGLVVASFGAADAVVSNGTSGRWTFAALMGCLTILGVAVVPIGAFSALRNERLEQTLELITLTALSPRRVVIGKLLAQVVKLATLFAGLAPFIAMSFLLGGIDFGTIALALLVLFPWSVWACAACLFLSSLLKTRAMSGLILGFLAIVMFLGLLVFVLPRMIFAAGMRWSFAGGFGVGAGSSFWWALAIAMTVCLVTMINLVLLAENRLSLPTEDRVTALRVGFFAQFLLIAGWTLSWINGAPSVRADAVQTLGILGALHLAVVAMFTLTEDLVPPRPVLRRLHTSSPWRWLVAMFRPGAGRGALYVLAQMALLLGAAWLLQPPWQSLRWILAACGYICFFTGVPVVVFRMIRPSDAAAFPLRVAVLVLVALALMLPDILFYLLWRPDTFDLKFAARHLVNPIRTLANWGVVEPTSGLAAPVVMGLTGLLTYLVTIDMGRRMMAEPDAIDPPATAAAAEPGSANVLY